MRPELVIIRKIGTIAAVPVTTEENSSSTYSDASLPGMRTATARRRRARRPPGDDDHGADGRGSRRCRRERMA